jgi:hypothetical protein
MTALVQSKLEARLAKGEERGSALLAVAEGTLLDGFKLHSRERMTDAVAAFESGLMLLVEAPVAQEQGRATNQALLKGKSKVLFQLDPCVCSLLTLTNCTLLRQAAHGLCYRHHAPEALYRRDELPQKGRGQ